MKNYIVAAVIIGLSIIVGLAFFGGKTVIEYGASAGPEHYNMEYFHAGLVSGGEVASIATSGSSHVQLTAANFCDNSVLYSNIYQSSTTVLYLPTGPQLIADCLPNIGDTKTVYYWNTATDTTDVTLTASTSITLLEPSGGDVIIESWYGGDQEWAQITCTNFDGATSTCLATSIQDAD